MALQKREKKLVMIGGPVLALVLVLNFTGVFDGKSKKANALKSKAAQTVKSAVKTAEAASAEASGVTADAVRYETWGDRDPFSKPVIERLPGATPPPSPIHVKGIVWMQGKPYVLINDVVLAVGEEKNGIRVDRIEGNTVYCRKGGSMYALQWSESP